MRIVSLEIAIGWSRSYAQVMERHMTYKASLVWASYTARSGKCPSVARVATGNSFSARRSGPVAQYALRAHAWAAPRRRDNAVHGPVLHMNTNVCRPLTRHSSSPSLRPGSPARAQSADSLRLLALLKLGSGAAKALRPWTRQQTPERNYRRPARGCGRC